MPVNGTVHPCLFLKLNKIWNFVPKGIKAANVDDPEYDAMTEELKEIIRTSGDADQVYIDCKGRFPADVEGVSLEYFPANRAIPSYFFPFSGGNYQSPLVAVKVRAQIKLSSKTYLPIQLCIRRLIFVRCNLRVIGEIIFNLKFNFFNKLISFNLNSIFHFQSILFIFLQNNLSVKSFA